MSFKIFSPRCDSCPDSRPFQQRRSFSKSIRSFSQPNLGFLVARRQEVMNIRLRFPNKVPVIVERYTKEKSLPKLDKTKFLVPHELQMSKFIAIIRNRMRISQTQSFYLIINNKTMAAMSKTMAQVYQEHQENDGFLYITYASQEMFGN